MVGVGVLLTPFYSHNIRYADSHVSLDDAYSPKVQPMQNLIDAKLLLKAFSIIEQQGQAAITPVGHGFEFNGMQVATGFDGYDLYFFAAGMTLTLGFHQKYHLDATTEQQVEQFIQFLKKITA